MDRDTSKEDAELWKTFIDNGLLWMVNMNLHLFGYAISYVKDSETGDINRVIPQRVDFSGFTEELNDKGYTRVKAFMKEHTV